MKYYPPLFLISLSVVFIIGCYLFPAFFFIILLINLIGIIILGSLRLWLASLKKQNNSLKKTVVTSAKVSIHLPVCQEPPKIVCNTIRSIVNQHYSNYELIVLIHQSDTALAEHIQDFCKKINRHIKVRTVKFAGKNKAAALNLCHKVTHPDSKYIFTLNADYWIHPQGIVKAVKQLEKNECDLLQFPRAYLNGNNHTRGIKEELDLYYQCYSEGATKKRAALSIGNLFLIKKEVLESIGGWPQGISEDAQLGIRLLENNYSIAYSNTIIGMGLMPDSYHFLNTQRTKWIFGNLQTLAYLWSSKKLSFRTKWIMTLQLTAWINFLSLPLLAFLSSPFLIYSNATLQPVLILAVASLYFHFALQLLLFTISTHFHPIKTIWGFMAHTSTILLGAFCGWKYLFFKDKAFQQSPKFSCEKSYVYEFIFYTLFLVCCSIQVVHLPWLSMASNGLLLLMIVSKLNLHFELKSSHQNLQNSLYQTDNKKTI